MGKIAFIFPGQGAQCAGMGRELYENCDEARRVLDHFEQLRPGTLETCFNGGEALDRTDGAQPCLYAVGLAAAAAFSVRSGIKPDFTAGFSLGELTAAAFAGMFNPDDGFRLVCRRGESMRAAAEQAETGMAAILKLSSEQVEELCGHYSQLYPVNYNSPGQISVAGLKTELDAFCRDVKTAGGRAVPLKVQGAFHSPFMEPAAKEFALALNSYKLYPPELTLYSDVTGRPYDGDRVSQLTSQITSPVRWQSIVEHMAQNGADTFVEFGPGAVLCGLIGRTLPSSRTFPVGDLAGLNAALEGVISC